MATDKGEAEITAWCVAHLAKALRRRGKTSIRRPSSRASVSIPRWRSTSWPSSRNGSGASLPLRWPSNTQPSPSSPVTSRASRGANSDGARRPGGPQDRVQLDGRAAACARRSSRTSAPMSFSQIAAAEEASLTFSELERRAGALAAQLVGRGQCGERAL